MDEKQSLAKKTKTSTFNALIREQEARYNQDDVIHYFRILKHHGIDLIQAPQSTMSGFQKWLYEFVFVHIYQPKHISLQELQDAFALNGARVDTWMPRIRALAAKELITISENGITWTATLDVDHTTHQENE